MPKKFRKKFRCGRVVLSSDGTVKKLNLSEGGGSRVLNWFNSYMNFETVRNVLIKMYHLGNSIGLIDSSSYLSSPSLADDVECETSLYDYRLQPLNRDKYPTVWKYIHDNGLNCNSTIVYLCTRAGKMVLSINLFDFHQSFFFYFEVNTNKPLKKKVKRKKRKDSSIERSLSPPVVRQHSIQTEVDSHSKPTSL